MSEKIISPLDILWEKEYKQYFEKADEVRERKEIRELTKNSLERMI